MISLIRGIAAGLGATFALSILMMAKGMMAPAMTLMLHLIFGAVLGFAYNRLAPAGGEAGSGASAED